MYHKHFGFFTSPFSLGPHLQFLFRSSAFEETMAHLAYGLESGEGIILITGEIGTGKTLALHNLSQHLPKTYRIALINVTQLDFRELLKMLLAELDVAVPAAADRADLLSSLKAELAAITRRGQRLLLIIDEAQNLDEVTLEGARLLTNLGPPEEQALQIVLSGQPGLLAKVNSPQLAQLRQRIRVHYNLEKLGPEETADYLAHRVKVAGCERNLFRKDAIQRIHALSNGIPRLVNTIADRALLAAYVDNAHEVHLRHVEEDKSLAKSSAEESIVMSPPESPFAPVSGPSVRTAPESTGKAEGPAVGLNVDIEMDKPALVATRRRTGTARSMLPGRLVILAFAMVALVAMALIAHYQGMIKLPWLPERRSVAGVAEVIADENLLGENGDRPLDIAATDSLDFIAASSDDSLTAAVDERLVAAGAVDPVIVEESTPEPGNKRESGAPITNESTTDTGTERLAGSPTPALPSPPPGFYVHVGSFREFGRAETLAAICAGHDLPTQIVDVRIDGQLWHRVHVGPCADQAEARQTQAAILDNNISTWTMIVRIH